MGILLDFCVKFYDYFGDFSQIFEKICLRDYFSLVDKTSIIGLKNGCKLINMFNFNQLKIAVFGKLKVAEKLSNGKKCDY